MEQTRRHGRVLTVASDISSFQLAAGDRAADRADAVPDDGTSSIYSTCSTYSDTQIGEDGGRHDSDDVHAARLRLAFQNLCHVSLRIARLRHSRSQVQEELAAAEEAVARVGSELLLERLDLDDAAKADEIVDVLLQRTEHPPPDVEPSMTTPILPLHSRLFTLQQTASRTGRLRKSLAQFDVRLETEQRLVLWPGLEQWRLAVAEHRHRQHRQRQRNTSKQTEEHDPVDDPDQLLQTVQRMLPRLDRQRLQRLWEHIGHALLSVPGTSGCPEPVPAQLFI